MAGKRKKSAKARAPRPPPRARLQKSALCRRLEVSRPTLDKFLKMVGAPEPDRHRSYDVDDVLKWINEHAGESSTPQSLQEWKIEEIKIRCEKMRDQLARDRGEFISKAEAARTIIPLMTELGELLRAKFVLEMPSRYRGRDAVECAQMNEVGADAVIKRFREGVGDLTPETP